MILIIIIAIFVNNSYKNYINNLVVILSTSLPRITPVLLKRRKIEVSRLEVTRELVVFLISDFGSGLCKKNYLSNVLSRRTSVFQGRARFLSSFKFGKDMCL